MRVIVGLGNPGPAYAKTRHNVGFCLVEALAAEAHSNFRRHGLSLRARASLAGQELILAKPQTFMNQSGQAVAEPLPPDLHRTVPKVFVAPIGARFFPAAQLFRQAEKELRPETEFGAVDFQEPGLVWYFRSQVKGWMTPLNSASAAQFMEKEGARFVILPTALVAKVFPNPAATWKSFSTTGLNIAKGKAVDLTLLLKPE